MHYIKTPLLLLFLLPCFVGCQPQTDSGAAEGGFLDSTANAYTAEGQTDESPCKVEWEANPFFLTTEGSGLQLSTWWDGFKERYDLFWTTNTTLDYLKDTWGSIDMNFDVIWESGQGTGLVFNASNSQRGESLVCFFGDGFFKNGHLTCTASYTEAGLTLRLTFGNGGIAECEDQIAAAAEEANAAAAPEIAEIEATRPDPEAAQASCGCPLSTSTGPETASPEVVRARMLDTAARVAAASAQEGGSKLTIHQVPAYVCANIDTLSKPSALAANRQGCAQAGLL
ncbi:MAG: hypothetical protein IPJ88_06485 [Myxococcales bacterium]|nr:MAG: hypothetical protein IPJ88_06485 [Myxococcales bacterium]